MAMIRARRLTTTRSRVVLWLVWLLVGSFGCASSHLVEHAQLSHEMATKTYQAIYAASLHQRISPDDLTQARDAYDAWSVAQWRLIAAAQQGRYDQASAFATQRHIGTLQAIAERNGLPPWQLLEKENIPSPPNSPSR